MNSPIVNSEVLYAIHVLKEKGIKLLLLSRNTWFPDRKEKDKMKTVGSSTSTIPRESHLTPISFKMVVCQPYRTSVSDWFPSKQSFVMPT